MGAISSLASNWLPATMIAIVALTPTPAGQSVAPAVAEPATADLTVALAGDGTFIGSGVVSGTVDTAAWTLVSDLSAGEPPRFQRAPDAAVVLPVVVPDPWHALGSNGAGNGALSDGVLALAVAGSNLYVGGKFTNAAGLPRADYIARWNGSSWSALGDNQNGSGTDGALNDDVIGLAVSGSNLYVGGIFTNAAGLARADYVARWNGSAWSALGDNQNGSGTDGALNDYVHDLAVSGSNLYVGGNFTNAAGLPRADKVARWNGSTWSALGDSQNGGGPDGALSNSVIALAVSGSNLYAGGVFINAAGLATADYVARWNGSTWSPLGGIDGGTNGALNDVVHTLAVSGSDLFVGGSFTNIAGLTRADYVARWNGTSWSALGDNRNSGFGQNGALNNQVRALAVSGTDLFAGGIFTNAAGLARADYVARWNGSAWSALGDNQNGSGTDGALNDDVLALAVSGNDLYVGGEFVNAAGLFRADRVARFGPPPPYRPDGRIRLGQGALVGNDIYNTDAANQAQQASAGVGSTVKFTISIQNDGASPDTFALLLSGGSAGYKIRLFRGTTEITDAVLGGDYTTPTVAPGEKIAIKVKVKVLNSAAGGSMVAGLVRPVSIGDSTKVDAVRFVVARN